MSLTASEWAFFSETTISFIQRLKVYAKEILQSEMGLCPQRSRFRYGDYSYKLTFVVFEGSKRVGYFDSSLFEIGVNKSILLESETVIKDLLRHELAHMMVFLKFKETPELPHGKVFREVCRSFGWGAEVYSATFNFNNVTSSYSDREERLISQVKKLLSLAQSHSGPESEAAALKANELLLKYNLKFIEEDSTEEPIFMARVMSGKRVTALQRAIMKILKTFYVSVIYNYGSEGYFVEVIGRRSSVELATYVCEFLQREMEALWKLAKKELPHLKGVRSRNSFFSGVAAGYVQKIEQQQKGNCAEKSLIRLRQLCELELAKVYPKLSHTRHHLSPSCGESHAQGQKAGTNLTIRPGLSQNQGFLGKLLSRS